MSFKREFVDCNASEKNRLERWTHSLPLLQLEDIGVVSKVDAGLNGTVTQLLKSGKPLVINRQFANAFPILNNSELYNRLGKDTTTVTLSGIDEDYLEQIFNHFPNLVNLSLENLWILRGDIKGAPGKLQKLTISHCKLNPSFVKVWFQSFSQTIQSLRLDRSPCEFSLRAVTNPSASCYIEALEKSNIRQIAVTGMSCYIYTEFQKGYSSLEHLSINRSFEVENMVGSSLERDYFLLHGESLKPVFHNLYESSYQSITIRVIRCGSEEERAKLSSGEEHLIEKITKHNPPAVEPNSIFKLNDDCLSQVLSFLDLEDYLNLFITHPQFRRLLSEDTTPLRKAEIAYGFLDDYPMEKFRSAFEAICRNLVSLEFEEIESPEVCEILSYCKNLRILELKDVYFQLDRSQMETLPSQLTTLTMKRVNFPQDLWMEWSRRLDPTLRVLKCVPLITYSAIYEDDGEDFDVSPDFTNLHNLQEFEVSFKQDMDWEVDLGLDWSSPKTFPSFLIQNKGTLEHLAITYDSMMGGQDSSDDDYIYVDEAENTFTDPGRKICSAIAKLVNLKRLHLKCFTPRQPCDLTGLPHLAELGIDYHRNIIVKKENIKQLVAFKCEFKDWVDGMTAQDIGRFNNLEELQIIDKKDRMKYEDLKPLAHLLKLATLRIPYVEEEKMKKILTELPHLTRLEVDRIGSLSLDFVSWLRGYLEEGSDKSIRINDVEFRRNLFEQTGQTGAALTSQIA